jgi:DNA-binding phage protein
LTRTCAAPGASSWRTALRRALSSGGRPRVSLVKRIIKSRTQPSQLSRSQQPS